MVEEAIVVETLPLFIVGVNVSLKSRVEWSEEVDLGFSQSIGLFLQFFVVEK